MAAIKNYCSNHRTAVAAALDEYHTRRALETATAATTTTTEHTPTAGHHSGGFPQGRGVYTAPGAAAGAGAAAAAGVAAPPPGVGVGVGVGGVSPMISAAPLVVDMDAQDSLLIENRAGLGDGLLGSWSSASGLLNTPEGGGGGGVGEGGGGGDVVTPYMGGTPCVPRQLVWDTVRG